MSWRDHAACRDKPIEWFYPADGFTRRVVAAAVAVCEACPVQQRCLAEAIDRDEIDGVWGGKTPSQRARMRMRGWKPAKQPIRVCAQGHVLSPDNVVGRTNRCRICTYEANRRSRARRQARQSVRKELAVQQRIDNIVDWAVRHKNMPADEWATGLAALIDDLVRDVETVTKEVDGLSAVSRAC